MPKLKLVAFFHQRHFQQVLVVVVLGAIGAYLVVGSHAASPYVSSEAESGTLTGTASTMSDANASGGSAIKFGSPSGSSILYPTTLSANHRYYLDQNGAPWFLMGETAQAMIANNNYANPNGPVADANAYFMDRHSKGISGVWIMLIADGHPASTRADGSMLDGTLPFTTPGDLSTPNPVYWNRVDQVLTAAQNNGVIVFANPAETSNAGTMIGFLKNNGPTKDRAYGAFIGNRYKNYTNIVWMLGNDFQTWSSDPTADADVAAMSDGIKSAETPGSTKLQTIELNYDISTSLDDTNTWGSRIGLNLAYAYYPTYDMVQHGYGQSPTMPVFFGEGNYEQTVTGGGFEDPVSLNMVRRQGWWTMTSGGIGQLWGTRRIQNWDQSPLNFLNTTGVQEYMYLRDFFTSREWYNLVPDTNASHTFLTAGYGTYTTTGAISNVNYVTAAVAPDGKFGTAYVPSGGTTITINMAKMSGSTTARWFDPTTGSYTTASGSPFANSGSHQFTSPSITHGDGTSDWVLVLES